MTTVPVTPTPQVLTWLVNQIAAQVDPGVLVVLGPQGTYTAESMILVACDPTGKAGVRRRLQSFLLVGGGGPDYLEEIIEIDVTISCWTGDTDPTDISNTAWALLGVVESVVRTDLTLGGNVNQSLPASTQGGTPVWTEPNGRQVDIVLTVEARNPL